MKRYQIEFDIQYGYWYCVMYESLCRRIDFVCNLIQFVGGSAAAAGVVAASPGWIAASGVLLALTAAISLYLQPGVKAERLMQAKHQWLDLKARMPTLDEVALAAEVAKHQKADLGMPTLSLAASNAAMRAMGYTEGFASLTRTQRMLAKLAS